MAKGFFKKDSLTKNLLLGIVAVGAITIAAASPYLLQAIVRGYFGKQDDYEARRKARKLRELQQRKLINIEELSSGKIRVTASKSGKVLARQYQFNDMRLKKPAAWDHFWRVIIYDIPKNRQRASQALSAKLHQFGLYQLQRSVWISPHECQEELEFICDIFELEMNKFIHYFKTRDIPKEAILKEWFEL